MTRSINSPWKLSDWQSRLAGYIRNPDASGIDDLDQERLSVYRELFFNNVEGIIRRAFPVSIAILGEKLWTELAENFFAQHKSSIRSYPRLASEFLAYIESVELDSRYPDFLKELLHYEWLELELDIAEGEMLQPGQGSVLDIVPELSELARIQSYQFPVHMLSPENVSPDISQPTHLILYRDNQWKVQFNELAPMSMALLTLVSTNQKSTSHQLVSELMSLLPEPSSSVRTSAEAFLQSLYDKGIIVQGEPS